MFGVFFYTAFSILLGVVYLTFAREAKVSKRE